MHLASLKVFCDVARQRSFSQAARVNDLTQSAVSQVISQLERRMRTRLIDRSTRPLQLTALGQAFFEGCQALLAQYDELEASIRSACAEVAGTVRIAAIYSVGLSDMGQYVRRFTARQPKVHIHIDYLHPDEVTHRVVEGIVDLGLVSFPRKTSELAAVPWRDEEMVFVCSPKHPLAGRRAVRPTDLNGHRFVHFDRNLVIRRRIDKFLREQRATVEVACTFDNIENIKQAVAVDAGVALLPAPTVHREVEAGTLVARPLAGCRFVRPLGIIHRRQRLSAAARGFMELLLEQGQVPAANGTPR
ncbi:MAG: LysR family transcriptional regulator [Gemmataceae bacterium]|nr:LysR family transcriptional regulator [Gemmataceae bacterium]